MQTPNVRASAKLVAVVAISAALAVAVLYWNKNSSEKSPTEYVKTQQTESSGELRRESRGDEPKSREAAGEKPDHTAKKLTAAWNRGSSREIASLFADNGALTIPNGSKIQSRSEIAKTIDEKRNGLLSDTTLSADIEEIAEVDAQTAIVKGRYQLAGIKILGFSKTANGTFVLRQHKNDQQWLISEAEVKNGDDG